MRQYYKAAALQGMVAGFQREAVDIVLTENWEEKIARNAANIAKTAAFWADAMIAEDEEAAKNG